MTTEHAIQQDSASWIFFVKVSFVVALSSMVAGIVFLPADLWIKGYLAMGILFTVGSTITLSKTLRDQHEAEKLIHKLSDAKTEKLLKQYEMATP